MATDPLIVDPARLAAAAAALRDLEFPDAPAPATARGADPISSAINETAPMIESPVLDGLPEVKAAVAKSASSMKAAAQAYADTDRQLGSYLAQGDISKDHDAGPRVGAARLTARDRGATAKPGATGATGATGSTGSTGSTGATGAKPTPKPTPTPTPAPNPTPDAGMPTLEEVVTAVTVATQVQAVATQAASQGMQAVQQLAGMATQAARRTPAAGDEVLAGAVHEGQGEDTGEAVPGDEDATDGADAGSTGAGRAPVDADRSPPETGSERLA